MPVGNLEKYRAFVQALVCDGHDFFPVIRHSPHAFLIGPLSVGAETIEARLKVMENDAEWHHQFNRWPNIKQIKADLEKMIQRCRHEQVFLSAKPTLFPSDRISAGR